jgi:hypothetical protein
VDGPANASPDDRHDQLVDASLLPSQPLTVEALRRPVESALWSNLKGVELANLAGDTLEEVTAAAERGIQRIRGNGIPWPHRHPASSLCSTTMDWGPSVMSSLARRSSGPVVRVGS